MKDEDMQARMSRRLSVLLEKVGRPMATTEICANAGMPGVAWGEWKALLARLAAAGEIASEEKTENYRTYTYYSMKGTK